MYNTQKPKFIAFYLPQYHPIPENDIWWGKGFTEWTNVAKAAPLFKGHYQPHLPADLGYYDLRVPEVREQQANLAREHGIEGFCYWHYWFAGKRLIERPFAEVLESGKPDFPFCLAWANDTWTGIWYGAPDKILMEQTYPGEEDFINHFYAVLPALKDERYIRVDGKPVFVVYRPENLPDPQSFVELWQDLAVKNGLKGIYFLGVAYPDWDYKSRGFDGIIFDSFVPIMTIMREKYKKTITGFITSLTRRILLRMKNLSKTLPWVYSYKDFVDAGLPTISVDLNQYPLIFPNWDNTPRSGTNGLVLEGSTPDYFTKQLLEAISQVRGREPEKQIIFIKAWNEWAEGNYLEPDQKFGMAYLDAIKNVIENL